MEIWTGFAIGFLGSFHCIGMCGPIALALPSNTDSTFKLFANRFLYNIGRVVTYSLFGAVFGLFGKQLNVVGLQQYASIGLGAIILITVLMPRNIKTKLYENKLVGSVNTFVKKSFSKLLASQSNQSFFLFGIINGFLPCGFVYVGLAGAISTGSVLSGTMFMFLFGLGTVPIMFAASVLGKFVNAGIRTKINKLIPVFAIILAVLFILRGLNLGIPYLSPKFMDGAPSHQMMHH